MGLFDNHNAWIDENYISVWEIIRLLKNSACDFEPWKEVGEFLGNIDAKYFKLYKKDKFKNLVSATEYYCQQGIGTFPIYDDTPITKLINSLMDINFIDEDDEIEVKVNKLRQEILNYYWDKKSIYHCKKIMELNLIPPPPLKKEADKYKDKCDYDQHYIQYLLYLKKLHEMQNKKDQLISKILDESNINHAPDLAFAVQLWEHLYLTPNKDNDSHSNTSNRWIKQNTNYDVSAGSAKRIREIVTPLKDWGSQRPKP